MVAPIVCGGFCVRSLFVFFIQYLYYFCNHLDGEERAGCFTLTLSLLSCDNQCSVALEKKKTVTWNPWLFLSVSSVGLWFVIIITWFL